MIFKPIAIQSFTNMQSIQVLEGKKIVLRKFYQPTDVFTSSRETAYTEEFLQEATWNVVLGHTQFVNIARVYNKMDRNQGEGKI